MISPSAESRSTAGGAALVVAATLLLSAPGCDSRPPKPKPSDPPGALRRERLHPAGELRLTSAGTKPRLKLRYGLVEGRRDGFRSRVAIVHKAAGQTSRLTVLLDWARTMTAVKGRQAQAEIRVERIRLARPPSIRDEVLRRLKPLTLRLQVDDRGRAHPGDGGASGLPATLPRTLLGNFTAPLPEDAVGDGATWERFEPTRLVLPKTQLPVRLGVRTRYSLKLVRHRGRERYALVTATQRLTAESVRPDKARQRVTGGGEGTAELKIDLRHGTVVSSKAELKLKLVLSSQGRKQHLEQTLSTTTRSIKLRPKPRHRAPHPLPRGRRATPG